MGYWICFGESWVTFLNIFLLDEIDRLISFIKLDCFFSFNGDWICPTVMYIWLSIILTFLFLFSGDFDLDLVADSNTFGWSFRLSLPYLLLVKRLWRFSRDSGGLSNSSSLVLLFCFFCLFVSLASPIVMVFDADSREELN